MGQVSGALEAAGVQVFGHPHFLDCGCPLYSGHPQNRHILVKLIICCPVEESSTFLFFISKYFSYSRGTWLQDVNVQDNVKSGVLCPCGMDTP